MKISCKKWNSLPLDDETKYTANSLDICYKINNLYACCIRNDEINNIIVFSKKYDVGNVKAILKFVKILYLQYGVCFIRVEGRKGRYHFFKKLFGMNMLLFPLENRDAYYCKIDSDIIKTIDKISKMQ